MIREALTKAVLAMMIFGAIYMIICLYGVMGG